MDCTNFLQSKKAPWRRTATNLSPTPSSRRQRCCGTECLHSQNPTPTARGWRDPNHVRGAASSALPGTARRRAPTSSCTAVAGASATTPTADSENRWKRAAQMQQQNLPRASEPNRFYPAPPLLHRQPHMGQKLASTFSENLKLKSRNQES